MSCPTGLANFWQRQNTGQKFNGVEMDAQQAAFGELSFLQRAEPWKEQRGISRLLKVGWTSVPMATLICLAL